MKSKNDIKKMKSKNEIKKWDPKNEVSKWYQKNIVKNDIKKWYQQKWSQTMKSKNEIRKWDHAKHCLEKWWKNRNLKEQSRKKRDNMICKNNIICKIQQDNIDIFAMHQFDTPCASVLVPHTAAGVSGKNSRKKPGCTVPRGNNIVIKKGDQKI